MIGNQKLLFTSHEAVSIGIFLIVSFPLNQGLKYEAFYTSFVLRLHFFQLFCNNISFLVLFLYLLTDRKQLTAQLLIFMRKAGNFLVIRLLF